MNNKLNQLIYKMWTPLYDTFFNSGHFKRARTSLFDQCHWGEGERVLFVGVGTGADLDYIQRDGLQITAIDYSSDMLQAAKLKYAGAGIMFQQMDAQHLSFPEGSFDTVVASLIVSVVPDGQRCLDEMVRVTRKGGTILIFDKFVPKHARLPLGMKLLRPVIALLGTDIGRSFEELIEPHSRSVSIAEDTPLFGKFNVIYRKIVLRKG